tara:strand:+ start:205 stop:627 length:423 start_codon:yes stop_codon:yes gene_type:complete
MNDMVNKLNRNTFFAGFIMIILNIGSRHVDLNLGESVEMFIKRNITREILIFAIFWMGTRDIITALILTIVFVIITQFFMNTSSSMCMLSEEYSRLKIDTNLDGIISDEEINKAMLTLERAKKQKENQRNIDLVNYYHST